MKRVYLLLSGLMAIAFAACTNDDFSQEMLPTQSEGQLITVKAYTANENPVSRIEQGWDEGKMKLTWSADDQFSVIRGSVNSTFTKSSEAGAGPNDFVGTLPDDGGTCYATYPVTDAYNFVSIPFDISNQSEGLPYLMYAQSDSGETYHFHHAVAYLKATFPEALKGKTATVALTLPSGIEADGVLALYSGGLSNGSKQIITKEVVFGNESTEVLLAIPPMKATNKTLKFLVSVGSDYYVATLAGSGDKAIEAGKYYSATIALEDACYLPKGYDFNSALKNTANYSSATSLEFEANSTRTGGAQMGDSKAYTLVDGTTLYVYTAAPEFIFNTDCIYMFQEAAFKSIKFNSCINTALVTDMTYMFSNCTKLTSLDVSSFNTAKVEKMAGMFINCNKLYSLKLNGFNTAKVTNMNSMFNSCYDLASLDVSSFDTAAVTTMKQMFERCYFIQTLNLSSFTFNADAEGYENMFSVFGLDVISKPATIYVKNQTDLETLTNASTGINADYAKIAVYE